MSADETGQNLAMYLLPHKIQSVMFHCKPLVPAGQIEGLWPHGWPDGFRIEYRDGREC